MNHFFLIIFSTFFIGQIAFAQNFSDNLKLADSLFKEKKYIEANEIYEQIYSKDDRFSPQMLLKMAYTHESSGDYTKALYYLNVFYNYHPEKKVLKKMEDLAIRHRLTGYNYTDLEYFISLYNQYYYYIIYFFLFTAISFYVYLIVKKINKRRLGLRPIFFILILLVVYIVTNYELVPMKGIISNDNAYLMSGPSAASEVKAITEKGHRVIVWSKNDIWYKVSWNGEQMYIRKNNLMLVGDEDHLRGESFSFMKWL
ncbi:MAG: tetratricopeptide repeat protein [Cytophagaceae bacterium]